MKHLAFGALCLAATMALLPAPAVAKAKKTKKPAATLEAMPPQHVIYDPETPGGPATIVQVGYVEPSVPATPLLTVTTDKVAGKGVAEEKDVAIEKGKKK